MEQKKFSIIPYLLRYRWKYLMGIVVLLIVNYAGLFIPEYTGNIIDGLTEQTMDMNGVLAMIGRILLMGTIMMAGRFGWRYFIIGSARGVELHLRNDMFGHLETLSARYYNSHKTGDLMAHFTNDLQAIRQAAGPAVITALDSTILTIMVLSKMVVSVNLRLTVLAFLPLILVAVCCYYFGIESKKRQKARQEAFSELSDQVQESLSGIRVLKAFVQEEKDLENFQRSNQNNMDKNLAMVKLRAVIGPIFDMITGISILITLIFGGRMVLEGTVTIGQFVAFNSYIGMLVWPMIACGDCINMFSQAAAAKKRISLIFAEKPDIIDKTLQNPQTEHPMAGEEGVEPELRAAAVGRHQRTQAQSESRYADASAWDQKHLTGELELKNLTFTYPDGEQPVLKQVSLHVQAGETLAILGRTGSGKSTLSDLLLRVYDCESGMLLLDGQPIDELPLALLHRDIAYVPQDNFLFSDTLEENIAFGLEERIADHPELKNEIREAAKRACIHENISEFPEGYETIVGERGVTLSGGQKQRSSIARALLKDAPILIMDDSLSAVDTDTEEQILKNLMESRKNKTTILIAHRISTLQNADHIAVLTDGCLTEYGTHEELIAHRGFYYQVYEKQQLEAQLDAIGEEEIKDHVPQPGTDKAGQKTNPASDRKGGSRR